MLDKKEPLIQVPSRIALAIACALFVYSGAILWGTGSVFAAHSSGAIAVDARTSDVVTLRLPYLESFKTTEPSEDEVYVVVAGRWNSGQTFSYRYPNASGHWDLNDQVGDPALELEDAGLLSITLDEGDEVGLVVMVMEEDGGTSGGYAALAAAALGKTGQPVLVTIGSVIAVVSRLFIFEDSDDVIGVFGVHVDRKHDTTRVTFSPKDRITGMRCNDPAICAIDMNGDGSNYSSVFAVY